MSCSREYLVNVACTTYPIACEQDIVCIHPTDDIDILGRLKDSPRTLVATNVCGIDYRDDTRQGDLVPRQDVEASLDALKTAHAHDADSIRYDTLAFHIVAKDRAVMRRNCDFKRVCGIVNPVRGTLADVKAKAIAYVADQGFDILDTNLLLGFERVDALYRDDEGAIHAMIATEDPVAADGKSRPDILNAMEPVVFNWAAAHPEMVDDVITRRPIVFEAALVSFDDARQGASIEICSLGGRREDSPCQRP